MQCDDLRNVRPNFKSGARDPRPTHSEPIVTPTNTFNYSETIQATHGPELSTEEGWWVRGLVKHDARIENIFQTKQTHQAKNGRTRVKLKVKREQKKE